MEATKLPLTIWFLAFYLIGQAKTSISSLQLSRQLGVAYNTAWMLHSKILRAMSEWDDCYVLQGKVQMDDAYFGGEHPGGKAGRGSENKVPIVAAISLNAAGHPIHAKISPVTGFTSEVLADWARQHLSSSSSVLSDGLALADRHIHETRCNRMGLSSWGGWGTVRVWGCHTNPNLSGFPRPAPR